MFCSIFVAIRSYQGKLIRFGTIWGNLFNIQITPTSFYTNYAVVFLCNPTEDSRIASETEFCEISNDVILRMIHNLIYIRVNIEIWLHKRKCYNMILESKGISINWKHSVCEEFYFLCIKYSIILRGRNNF